jgi:hypothetical protein
MNGSWEDELMLSGLAGGKVHVSNAPAMTAIVNTHQIKLTAVIRVTLWQPPKWPNAAGVTGGCDYCLPIRG